MEVLRLSEARVLVDVPRLLLVVLVEVPRVVVLFVVVPRLLVEVPRLVVEVLVEEPRLLEELLVEVPRPLLLFEEAAALRPLLSDELFDTRLVTPGLPALLLLSPVLTPPLVLKVVVRVLLLRVVLM